MNNKHLSALDSQQMLHRTLDDQLDAQRVYIVNAQDLTGTIKIEQPDWSKMNSQVTPILQEAMIEYREIKVPEIVREVQIVHVPQIVKEIEYREIEKPIVMVEYKTIEVPVVVKEIQIIEKPVVIVERVPAPFPMFFKALLIIQTAASILFSLLLLKK